MSTIEQWRSKIGAWKITYPTVSFRLEIIPHTQNQGPRGDNILLIAQKN